MSHIPEEGLTVEVKGCIARLKKGELTDSYALLCSTYVVLSIAYHMYDKTLAKDHVYDRLCKYLLENWSRVPERFKTFLVSEDALRAGTGYHLTFASKIPARHECLIWVAWNLIKRRV
jgi:hypothetical protein